MNTPNQIAEFIEQIHKLIKKGDKLSISIQAQSNSNQGKYYEGTMHDYEY